MQCKFETGNARILCARNLKSTKVNQPWYASMCEGTTPSRPARVWGFALRTTSVARVGPACRRASSLAASPACLLNNARRLVGVMLPLPLARATAVGHIRNKRRNCQPWPAEIEGTRCIPNRLEHAGARASYWKVSKQPLRSPRPNARKTMSNPMSRGCRAGFCGGLLAGFGAQRQSALWNFPSRVGPVRTTPTATPAEPGIWRGLCFAENNAGVRVLDGIGWAFSVSMCQAAIFNPP